MASSNSTASFTAVNDGEFGHLDLTGKLIIKVALGDDIRRIPIHNEDITYDELILMMQRVFRGHIGADDDVQVKYRDEDQDLITIADSADLQFAIQCSRILKLTLTVNGQPLPLCTDEVRVIRKDLQLIRNRCNTLLDRLDAPRMAGAGAKCADSNDSTVTAASAGGDDKPVESSTKQSVTTHREFDPIKSLSNGPPVDDRRSTASPESVSSLSSQQNRQQQQQAMTNVSAPELRSLANDHSAQQFTNQVMSGQQPMNQFPTQPPQSQQQSAPQQRFDIQAQPYPSAQFPAPNRQNPTVATIGYPQPNPMGQMPPTSLSGPPQGMGGYPSGGQQTFGAPPPGPLNPAPFGAPPQAMRPPFGAPPPSGQPLGAGPPPQSLYSQTSGPPPTSTVMSTGQAGYGSQSMAGGPPSFGHPSPQHGFGGQPPPTSLQQQQQQSMPSPQQQSMPSGPYQGMGGPPPTGHPPTGGPPMMTGPIPGGMNPYSRGVGANRPRYPPNPGFPQQ